MDKQKHTSATNPNQTKTGYQKIYTIPSKLSSNPWKATWTRRPPQTAANHTHAATLQFHDSLNELKTRDDIIVTKADKGGTVVIMNVDDYIKEANRQLDNTEFYTKLITNPTTTNYDIVNNYQAVIVLCYVPGCTWSLY